MTSLDLSTLRRWPDVEAENLFAYDASDRLILDLAQPFIDGARLAVIGDNYGALTLGSGAHDVRVHQDDLVGERALAANAAGVEYSSHPLGESLLAGATLVLMQVPRSLDELDEQLAMIARYADPSVTVVAGGRIKHLTPTMNPLMLRYFESLDVSLAQHKSRGFTLRGVIPQSQPWLPKTQFHSDLGLWVAAHGGVFAGTSIDMGTRLLLGALNNGALNNGALNNGALKGAEVTSGTAIDLGCGTGVLASSLARSNPGMRVIATDQSAAALASAALTAELNGLADRVELVRDDGLESQQSESVDRIVLNPPFHIGSTVHTGIALRMVDDAARVLRVGGQLWTVFNTHLGYRQALARMVGPTDLVTHNAKFTVTVSRKIATKD